MDMVTMISMSTLNEINIINLSFSAPFPKPVKKGLPPPPRLIQAMRFVLTIKG